MAGGRQIGIANLMANISIVAAKVKLCKQENP
jgi:hypothetical protein